MLSLRQVYHVVNLFLFREFGFCIFLVMFFLACSVFLFLTDNVHLVDNIHVLRCEFIDDRQYYFWLCENGEKHSVCVQINVVSWERYECEAAIWNFQV